MKLFKILIFVFGFLFFTNCGMATEKKLFENYLVITEKKIDQYTDDAFYSGLLLTHNSTKEKKKFKDFTEVEQQIFKLSVGQILSSDYTDTQNQWVEEEKAAEVTPASELEASKKDVQEYSQKLLALRQKNAVKLERFIKELFEKHADDFTNEEKDYITKKVKSYNDKNNLIKRGE